MNKKQDTAERSKREWEERKRERSELFVSWTMYKDTKL